MTEVQGYARLCLGEVPHYIRETRLSSGNAEVRISPIGATVTSWRIGENNIITPPKVHIDPNQTKDIYRGGIPILFPIAGTPSNDSLSRRLNQHGFARDLLWQVSEIDQDSKEKNNATFRLTSDVNSKDAYPFDFEILNKITLLERSLRYDVQVRNTGDDRPMPYVLGFHPYFSLDSKDTTGITTTVPGFETNPEILRNSIIVDAPSEQSTFTIPGKGKFTLKYSNEFRRLIIWTDNPGYICFEPWTSGPKTIDTDESLRAHIGETKNLFFEISLES